MKKGLVILVLAILLMGSCFATVWAAEENAPLRGWYPTLGAGVRALGMGGAFTAVADDSSASLWNPAGIWQVPLGKVDLMHTDLYGMGISYDYAAGIFSLPLLGRSGMTFSRLDASSALTFPYQETAVVMSKARPVTLPFFGSALVGVNFKYLPVQFKSEEFEVNAQGLGFDLGVLLDKGKFRFGGMLSDPYTIMQGTKKESGTVDSKIHERLVSVLTVGGAFLPDPATVLAVDARNINHHDLTWHIGVERQVAPGVALRAGLNDGKISVGFGIKAGAYEVNYAFQQDKLGDAHRIGFGMQI